MVGASAKSSTSTGNRRKAKGRSDATETQPQGAAEPVETAATDSAMTAASEASPNVSEGSAADSVSAEAPNTIVAAAVLDATGTAENVIEDLREPPAAPPPPAPQQRASMVPLVIGGIVAAAIGYGAAYMGLLPARQDPGSADPAVATALTEQGATLAALQDQLATLTATVAQTTPLAMGEVDLSPVIDQIAALSAQIDAAGSGITRLADRVDALENRPMFTGNADADVVAAQQAADARAAALAAERDALAAEAAAREAAAAEAATQAAEAEASAAQAIAAAEAALARAAAEAALGQVQAALVSGSGFAAPLATIAATVDIPAALQAVAEAGVPTQDALARGFAPLARAALPVALQETAGESMGERLGAFVIGQIGGRAVTPREGDDPDAVLSRVGAAVADGDLDTALAEIAALPQGARDVLAPWVADVEARRAAEAGLATLGTALAATGN
ncbi:hypothetical protein LSUCC0031_13765 [Rhodobacterales bacterium LSUCC0031]|nr:hypothetical protein [Rhodobacterales bacterium LSUCC0031]